MSLGSQRLPGPVCPPGPLRRNLLIFGRPSCIGVSRSGLHRLGSTLRLGSGAVGKGAILGPFSLRNGTNLVLRPLSGGGGGTELLDYTSWIFVLLGFLFVFVSVCQYFCIFDKMGNTSFTSPEA